MALVKFGGGIVGMTGSIAGNTFARNRYGSYVRARTVPVNPATTRQQLIRSVSGQLVALWSGTLTAAQREAWRLYALNVPVLNRLGESVNLSGFNMYVRSNAALLYNGMDAVADAPTTFALANTDPTLTLTATGATDLLSVVFDNTLAWATEDEGALLLYEGRPYGVGQEFYAGPWSGVGKVEGDGVTAPTSPATFTSRWTLTVGQRIKIRARVVRADARLSGDFFATATVA